MFFYVTRITHPVISGKFRWMTIKLNPCQSLPVNYGGTGCEGLFRSHPVTSGSGQRSRLRSVTTGDPNFISTVTLPYSLRLLVTLPW